MRLARDHEAEHTVHRTMAGWPEWAPKPQVYTGHGFTAFVGREHFGGRPTDPLRWHISVTGPNRIPTWDEMVSIAHDLRPGVPFVISVPPRNLWMNLHPHCLHLHEVNDPALLEEWRVNATGQAPS